MKNFHDFYFGMTNAERQRYVTRVGTTIHFAERVAGGFRRPSLLMAERLVKASRGKTSFEAILKTWHAKNG